MNILFVFSDQQNRYALGCMGNPNVDTPNLDALAKKGVLLNRFYVNDPICTSSRANLMIGQYTNHSKVYKNSAPLPEGVPTIADAFETGGYNTSYVGKWHLGGMGNGIIESQHRAGFPKFNGYQCYNGFYKDVCFYDECNREARFEKHRTEVTTDIAIDQMNQLSKSDKPFLLMVSYQAPHYPVQPAPFYEEKYKGRKIIRRQNCQDIDPYTPTFSPPSPKPVENDPDYKRYGNNLDEYLRLYNAMCTQIDDNVGKLLHRLGELGIADDTMVVYTSDHGDMQGSHGLKNKCLPHEESTGVPFISFIPRAKGGLVTNQLASMVDMMPTFLDIAGLPPVSSVDGKSIASILMGADTPVNECVFSERQDWCMVVKNGWKLVANREGSKLTPSMFINLDEDPFELTNLLFNEGLSNQKEELFRELQSWENRFK